MPSRSPPALRSSCSGDGCADKVALAAGAFIVLLVLCAIFAPLIVKLVGTTGPTDQNPEALDSFGTPTGPSSDHIFGVDTARAATSSRGSSTAPGCRSRWR